MTGEAKFCTACGTGLSASARFCSECGARVGVTHKVTPKGAIVIVLVSAAIGVAGWMTQRALAGEKPTKVFERADSGQQASPHQTSVTSSTGAESETLRKLREAVEKSPNDLGALRVYAQAMLESAESQESPSPQLVLELVDALRTILAQDENDRFALIALADVSLNQRVVPEAIKYYERYLALEPDDQVARARYASALTFGGRSEEAVKVLQDIVAKNPQDFHALAYLAVTYAQRGEKDKSIETGQRALAIAPSDDARARFGAFLDGVKESPPEEAKASGSAPSGTSSSAKDKIESELRAHPIAGSKFSRAEISGPVVSLFFNQFPMQAMPEAIREKFVTGTAAKVKEAAGPDAKTIRFVDAETGAVMVERPLE